MVENQHKKITGYRDLTESEIALMNDIKAHEAATAALHARVRAVIESTARDTPLPDVEAHERQRQAAVARTEFEHAFMRLVRAVAAPATPWGR